MEFRNLITKSNLKSIENYPLEFVERKGIGHPDTLSDGIAESISIAYSRYCLENFGVVLHQTLDKIMLMGGLGKFSYGIGEMTKPWRLILNGRLSDRFGKEKVPHKEIAIEAAKDYLKSTVPKLDIEKWLKIYYYTSSFSKNPRWFRPESIDDIPDAKNPYANDTSVCSGYWPLSLTERLTLLMESYFYNPDYSPRFSYIGQDIKVMCVRKKNNIEITMCVPFFSKDIPSREIYFERKEVLYKSLYDLAKNFVGDSYSIELFLNTQDEMVKKDPKSIGHYFVISGSALDSGEEGLVGRGNRSRGIISSVRPTSLEAIWGKNPVYYVGKIYNYLADIIAKKISENFNCECNVYISSKNGDPVSQPDNIFIQTSKKISKKELSNIIDAELDSKNLTRKIIYNKPFIPIPGGGHGYSSF